MDKREKRQETKFMCGECGKEFKPQKGRTYGRYQENGDYQFVCGECYEKWEKHWEEVKKIEVIMPRNFLTKAAKVEFADGNTIGLSWCYLGDTVEVIDYDTPQSFDERLAAEAKKYLDEQNKTLIIKTEFVEGFDENTLTITYASGEKKLLRWKYSRQGQLFIDPLALEDLKPNDETISKIYTDFAEWQSNLQYQASQKTLSTPLDRMSDFAGLENQRSYQEKHNKIISQ